MLPTSEPLLAFMAASSSDSVSTMMTESIGPNGSAWCSDHAAGGCRTQAGGHVGRGVLSVEEGPVAHRAPVQRDAAAPDGLVPLGAQVGGLGGVDDRAEVQVRERLVGLGDGQRMAEADRLDHRQVRLEECREQPALDHIAGVGGAALLGVLEPLAQVLGQEVPLGEVPDAPGVEALLFEHVPPAGVGQRHRRPPAVGPPADERQGPDAVAADECLAEMTARPRTAGSPADPARRIRAWARVRVWNPPWLGVLATTALPASSCTSSAWTWTLIG